MRVYIYSVCTGQNEPKLLASFLDKSQALYFVKKKWEEDLNHCNEYRVYKQIELPSEIIQKHIYTNNGILNKVKQE